MLLDFVLQRNLLGYRLTGSRDNRVDCRTVSYASGESGALSKPRFCIGGGRFAIQVQ